MYRCGEGREGLGGVDARASLFFTCLLEMESNGSFSFSRRSNGLGAYVRFPFAMGYAGMRVCSDWQGLSHNTILTHAFEQLRCRLACEDQGVERWPCVLLCTRKLGIKYSSFAAFHLHFPQYLLRFRTTSARANQWAGKHQRSPPLLQHTGSAASECRRATCRRSRHVATPLVWETSERESWFIVRDGRVAGRRQERRILVFRLWKGFIS